MFFFNRYSSVLTSVGIAFLLTLIPHLSHISLEGEVVITSHSVFKFFMFFLLARFFVLVPSNNRLHKIDGGGFLYYFTMILSGTSWVVLLLWALFGFFLSPQNYVLGGLVLGVVLLFSWLLVFRYREVVQPLSFNREKLLPKQKFTMYFWLNNQIYSVRA